MSDDVQIAHLTSLAQHFSDLVSTEVVLQEWGQFHFIIRSPRHASTDMENFMKAYVHDDAIFPTAGLAHSHRFNYSTSVDCLMHLYIDKRDVADFKYRAAFYFWIEQNRRIEGVFIHWVNKVS